MVHRKNSAKSFIYLIQRNKRTIQNKSERKRCSLPNNTLHHYHILHIHTAPNRADTATSITNSYSNSKNYNIHSFILHFYSFSFYSVFLSLCFSNEKCIFFSFASFFIFSCVQHISELNFYSSSHSQFHKISPNILPNHSTSFINNRNNENKNSSSISFRFRNRGIRRSRAEKQEQQENKVASFMYIMYMRYVQYNIKYK